MDNGPICYGMEYCSDFERLKYVGSFSDSLRYGKGILYDRNGVIEYDGLWKNNEPYSSAFDGYSIDNRTLVVSIPNKSLNNVESFLFPPFLHSLKSISIGKSCCEKVRSFNLDGISELESIVIGMESFTLIKDTAILKMDERTDGLCRIVNCRKLKSIRFEDHSFWDYHSLELEHLPSLQFIEMGRRCFYLAPSFSLTGLLVVLV